MNPVIGGGSGLRSRVQKNSQLNYNFTTIGRYLRYSPKPLVRQGSRNPANGFVASVPKLLLLVAGRSRR
jgi:hypothetical protein